MEHAIKIRWLLLVILLANVSIQKVYSQKQVVILKREKVKLRLNPGDDFVFRLKGNKTVRDSYINNIFDTAVVAHKDVIPLHKIDRIYFRQTTFTNLLGSAMVIGGLGYFAIDQFNVLVVQGEKGSLDKRVTNTSVALVAVGLPLMLIKKKSQKIGGKYRILVVSKGSPFYREALRTEDFIFDN